MTAERAKTYKGYTVDQAVAVLLNNGYKDVTDEANKQNKRLDFAVFADPSGIGVHYCEFDYDVIELALEQLELLHEPITNHP